MSPVPSKRSAFGFALTALAIACAQPVAHGQAPAAEPLSAAATTAAPSAPITCPGAVNLVVSSTLSGVGLTGPRTRAKDGMLALEGTFWNAPDAALLADTRSHLMFDFGAPRELRGLVLQGDNNDSYQLEGSLDATTWKPLWLAPMTEVGQGLRTRSWQLPQPTAARYLRVTPRAGDGFFSISEVQAYCKLPAVFPPLLRHPPKKVGWNAIDNDGMVAVKAWIATFAALLLALAYFTRVREARLRSVGLRAAIVLVLLLATAASAALGYMAMTGKGPTSLMGLARVRGSMQGWYYTAGILGLCTLSVIALFCKRGGPRLWDTLLAIVGVLSFTAWWNFGHYHFDHYIHIWEHYHYIVGAKYGPELRYARLYQCTAVADVQDGQRARVKARKMRRIESDNELGTTDEILAKPELCLSHFSAPRWDQFKKDVRFFRGRFSRDRWDQSQSDHGYNGTPVWAIVARWLGDHVEMTWDNIVNLGIIDSAYLIAMWLSVLWAFGWRSACVAMVWWGLNFPARFYWNGGSFLRYDWILWMVVGLCFLRKKHHALGGAALTYATLLRVFPGFIVAAIVLKALYAMVAERRVFLSREHVRFAAGCIVALAVLIPASSWATGGLDAWPEFAHNSKKHLSTALTNNMGLKTVMGYDFGTRAQLMRNDKLEDPFEEWKDAKQHFYGARAPVYYALLLMFCYMLARAGYREEDWAAACLGAGLIVMAAELTCYYYGFLLPYGLLWTRRKLPGVLSAALAAATCFIYAMIAWNDEHFAAMSLATVIVVVAVTAQAAFGKRAVTQAESS